LDLTNASSKPLEIVVSGKTGTVGGSATDDKGAPAAGVTIVLVPQNPKRRERADWYRTATTDPNGKFSMAGAPPGDYKLFAWEDVEGSAWLDPEFLRPVENQGKPITVREGGSETVQLKTVAQAAPPAQ
jgi:hypothetical protein